MSNHNNCIIIINHKSFTLVLCYININIHHKFSIKLKKIFKIAN